MRSFASDNNSGVHPLVMEALNQANQDHAVGYGDDAWTEEAVRKIREAFTPDCEPLFVFNGTGSNAVALQLCTRSYNSIICAETAHIYVDECGSPARMTGCQIRPVATPDGKLTPDWYVLIFVILASSIIRSRELSISHNVRNWVLSINPMRSVR